ncbi:MAG: serine protease, partial [Pirellulaceae bacterium]
SCIAVAEGGRQGLATGKKILDQTIRRAQKLQKQFPAAHNLTLMSAFNNRAIMHLRERKADLAVQCLMNAASFSKEIPFVVYHNATLLLEESAPPTTLKLGNKSRSDLVKLLASVAPQGPGSVVPRRYMYSIRHDEFESWLGGKHATPAANTPNAIHTATEALPIEPGFVQFGSGSGFLISPTLVLTNRHVVDGYDQGLRFRVKNERDYPEGILARVKKVSDVEDWDLAVLELTVPLENRVLPIRLDDVRGGENLFVVGYPLPDVFEQSVTVTSGLVSKLLKGGRHILHDAATNGGNSGGPCIDDKGNVMGVHFSKFILGKEEGGNARNLAVNSSAVVEFLKATDGYSQLPPRTDMKSRPDMLDEVTRGVFLVEIWGSGETVRKLDALKVLPGDLPEVAIKKYGMWPELTCFGCQGLGFRDCQACVKGVISVLKPVQVGVNFQTGAPITRNIPSPEKCNACNGNGGFRCGACSNGRLNF